MSAYKIEEIEGIGPFNAKKLSAAKIETTADILDFCACAKGRKETAEKTGCSEKELLTWANKADLMRIKGVAEEYSDLLEQSGVDTVKELRTRRADNLTVKMTEVNEVKNLTRALPSEKTVQGWIDQAKEIEPKITH